MPVTVKRMSVISKQWNQMEVNTTKEKILEYNSMLPLDRPDINHFFPELNEDEMSFIQTGVTTEELEKWEKRMKVFNDSTMY